MNEEQYSDLVAADARNNTTAKQYQLLRSDLERWKDELVHLMSKIDGQLTGKRAELYLQRRRLHATEAELVALNAELAERAARAGAEFTPLTTIDDSQWVQIKAEHEQWRVGSLRFKRALADRLAECKRLRRERNGAEGAEVIRLRRAIETHKSELITDNDAYSDADEDLWAVLDTITGPG